MYRDKFDGTKTTAVEYAGELWEGNAKFVKTVGNRAYDSS